MENSGDTLNKDALLHIYKEICNSYRAIDEFRTKLLGFLPLSSLVGIFLLGDKSILANQTAPELIAFVSVFASAFTLALFIYEIRGILRCNDLIQRGEEIERSLNIKGQFFVCKAEHQCYQRPTNWTTNFFNAKFAACIIYSTVFAAWVFMALRLGFGIHIYGCVTTALIAGLTLSILTYKLVKVLIAS